jgi:hypothetical protein
MLPLVLVPSRHISIQRGERWKKKLPLSLHGNQSKGRQRWIEEKAMEETAIIYHHRAGCINKIKISSKVHAYVESALSHHRSAEECNMMLFCVSFVLR